VVISGPSGSGKTTLISGLLDDPRCRLAVSATTRPPREGERDGVEYHFVDRPRFERMIREGGLLEWAEVHGDLYGTPKAEIATRAGEEVILLDVDSQGFASLKRAGIPFVSVFVAAPSMEALERRLRSRGTESEDRIARRLRNAASEMAAKDTYDHLVVNHEIAESLRALRRILGLEASDRSRDPTPQTKVSR
jgi:guanylate kinase